VPYDPTNDSANVLDLSVPDSVLVLSSASIIAGSDLNDAAWTKTQVTVTADVAGTQDRLTVSGGAPSCVQSVTNGAGGTTPVPLATAFWASYESIQWAMLETRASTAASQIWFDIQNGVVGTVGANLAGASITPETRNGVSGFRCSVRTVVQGGTHAVRLFLSSTDILVTAPLAGTSMRFDDITVTQVRVASLTNRKTGVVWAQATVNNQPEYEAAGLGGAPCMRGYGNQYIISSEAVALLPNAAAYTILAAGSVTSVAAAQAFLGYGDGAQATARTRAWGVDASGKWLAQVRSDANVNAAILSTANADTSPHVYESYGPGATTAIRVDGGAADPAEGSALNPGTLTPGQAALFARPASTVNLILTGRIGRVVLYSADVGPGTRALMRQRLGAQFGIVVA
jgi:hypothetical protein